MNPLVFLLLLIVPSGGPGTSTQPDHVPEDIHPNKSVEPSVTAGKNESKPGSPTAKLLCGVRDSMNAFGPLRSIARALCFILENCMVYPPCHMFGLECSQYSQQTDMDIRAIELLAPRIRVLSESLCAPIKPGDVNEEERGKRLEQ